MIRATEEEYEHAQTEHTRLSAALAVEDKQTLLLKKLLALHDSCTPALENWDNLERKEKRVILRTFIERIEALPEDYKSLRLFVYWRDGNSDELFIRGGSEAQNSGLFWLTNEVEVLLELFDGGASQVEIAQAFPTRTWSQINNKLWRQRGSGMRSLVPRLVKLNETYEDYLKRIEGEGASSVRRRWSVTETQLLLEMVDAGATQVEIAQEFPDRTWRQIMSRMYDKRGSGSIQDQARPIEWDETYQEYLERTGEANPKEDRDDEEGNDEGGASGNNSPGAWGPTNDGSSFRNSLTDLNSAPRPEHARRGSPAPCQTRA